MNESHQPGRRTSRDVKVPLLIAAGLLGVPLAISLAHLWADEEEDPAPPAGNPPPVVNADTAYPMNHFVPGAGYYHVPYHAWFPFPYNHYDAARGWYRGGQWRNTMAATGAERSGFSAGAAAGAPDGTATASRPLPEAVRRANAGAMSRMAPTGSGAHVIRGGFGFSAHPSVS